MENQESKMRLPSLDELFTTQKERDEANLEKVINIKLSDIEDFFNHPFKVFENDEMLEMVDSVREKGVLVPAIVRKKDNGKYEMIAGHRRKKACELAELETIPCIVRDLSDDEATIIMVDSNLQREKIFPSERAFAYKMKMDAMKHQGKTTSDPQGPKLSTEIVGKRLGDSSTNVKRYIRLTYLIPELLKLVDETVLKTNKDGLTMGIKPAVELSYLGYAEQKLVLGVIEYSLVTPSHAQTIKIRKLAKEKKLDFDTLEKLLDEKKGNQNEQIAFNKNKIENVLPNNIKKRDKRYIEQYIIKAIIEYSKQNTEEADNVIVQDLIF